MNKKEKKLEKALKLAGIDKEKWDDVVDLLSDEEEVETKPKEEEVNEKEEEKPKVESTDDGDTEPKEEPKPKVEEQPKEETKPQNDDVLKEALEMLKAQGEQIKTLQETISKNESFGYSPKPKQGKTDTSNEDIARKMENLK